MSALIRMNLAGDVAKIVLATCTKCGETKTLSEFHKVSAAAHSTNVRTDCKACTSARAKEYRGTHKAEIKASVQKHLRARDESRVLSLADRECRKCGAVKPVSEFYKDYQTVSGYHAACAECVRVSHKPYWDKFYSIHRAEIIEATAEYERSHPEYRNAKNHRRRALRIGAIGSCSTEQLKARFEFYGNRCAYCGAPATDGDHVIALARGGSNWPANIRPACKSCNSSKRTKKLFTEWNPGVRS